jgi:S-disulfanyl-L-cysteine oxidoreductase SoxD
MRRKMHEVHMLDKTYASLPVLLAAGLLASGASAPLSAGTSPSNTPQQEPTGQATQAGWYTQAQANQGQVLYNSYCAECHRPDLTGAMGPALLGRQFVSKWKTLGDLYNFEHTTMPALNPGAVPEAQLVKITAYILSQNGFPNGNAPLEPGGKMMGRVLKP